MFGCRVQLCVEGKVGLREMGWVDSRVLWDGGRHEGHRVHRPDPPRNPFLQYARQVPDSRRTS